MTLKNFEIIQKILIYFFLISCLGITGCFSAKRVIYKASDTANTIVNEGIDIVGNDIKSRLNGKLKDVNLNIPFQLAYDQTAEIKNTGFRLKFSAVTEESRCSTDIDCNRSGQVTVLLMVSLNGAYYGNYSLTLNREHPEWAVKKPDNYTIRLNNLEPITFSSYNRPLNTDYSLNITVSKN